MLLYIIAFIIIAGILPGYFRMANHFNIIDKPNERSSHSYITIRGGGIVFPAAALLWFLMYGFHQPWIIFALLLLATVSFLDDAKTLSSKIRIAVHLVAVCLLFWQIQLFDLPWYYILLACLMVTGWINAFNFMDGINGITAFYGLVALGTFAWLNRSIQFVSQELIILLIFSVLIFAFFNARKRAKTFAGDVGSVSLAFLLAWFIVSLIIKTGRFEYILMFAVYGIDSVITIMYRLQKRENIFEAHRTHLYQYLSNEFQWPHVIVSVIYSVIQLGINYIAVKLIAENKMNWQIFLLFLLVLSTIYMTARLLVLKEIRLKLS